jgi:hypothetical protein
VGAKPAVFDPALVSKLAGSMRSLAVLPEMFVYEIYCRDDRRRLSGPGYEYSWNLVMMRSGGFLQRLDGREDFYDATSAFVSRPGQERYAGHPAGPGDVSTGIWLSERLIEDYFDGGPGCRPAGSPPRPASTWRTACWSRPAGAALTPPKPPSAPTTCWPASSHRTTRAGAHRRPRRRTGRWPPTWPRPWRPGT